MAVRTAPAPPSYQSARLTPRLLLAAGLEIGAAVAVAALVLHNSHPPQSPPHHSHSGMAAMHPAAAAHWSTATIAIGVLASGALVWWAFSRAWAAAVLAAAALAALAASPAVRTTAAASHVVAMAALEVLAVVVPLLLVAAAGRRPPARPTPTTWPCRAAVIAATATYSILLIALHLPGIHNRAGQLGFVPLWLAPIIVVVGIGYWASILTTAGLVRTAVRRRGLVIGQEVGAILALAAIIGPDTTMGHSSPLGIPAQLDHRLGGVLMLVTCAAVTLPLLKMLAPQTVEESDAR